jgi:PKD repeat protein
MSELEPTFYRGASGIGYYLTLAIREMKEEAGMISSVPKTPPILSLFEPQIKGLEVLINGVASPGHKDANINRMHWDWGDGFSEDHWFPASHTYSKPGTYTVTVTSYQSDGLSTTKTLTVKVEAGNSPPVADFSYIPLNPLAGESVSFADQSYDPEGNVVFWRWDFGDGTTSYERNPKHVFSSPGTYTVTLTVKDDKGAEKSTSRAIYVGKREEAGNSSIVELAAFILVVVVVVTILALSRGKGGREVVAERPPAETATVQVSPDALRAELERYESYLRKLEELKAEGKVSEQVYQALKREYEAKVEELRRAFRRPGAS